MINSMIEWDHSIEWDVANFASKGSRSGELVVEIDLSKEGDQFLSGHAIDGRVLFPATGYLVSQTFKSHFLRFTCFFFRLDSSLENLRKTKKRRFRTTSCHNTRRAVPSRNDFTKRRLCQIFD